MTEDDVIAFVSTLPGVHTLTAGEADGSPEIAWGDTFFTYAPDGHPGTRMPFATIVTKDYPGFDTASGLDRPGVFRVNVNTGREAFERLLGHPPAARLDHDHTARDRFLPHPVYASQGWISVLNPGEATSGPLRLLLTAAHARAVQRDRPSRRR